MVKVYKVEILIVDHDKCGNDEIKSVIENTHYPNRCIMPKVMKLESCEVEWSDEHPLNNRATQLLTYLQLFE